MSFDLNFFLVALIAFGCGSIPIGVIISSIFGLGNLRAIGSGNVGATNVLRTGNKLAAILTLLFDALKGAMGVWVATIIAPGLEPIGMLFAVLGHCYSPFLKFRGGKGVATYFGGLFALNWIIGFIAIGIWLVTALLFRISSLAALVMIVLVPIILTFSGTSMLFVIIIMITSLVVMIRHQENIIRILNKEETKIGQK